MVLPLARSAVAMDATLALADLHRTRWTTREGAPADVSALAQTPDGALWIAASTGLVRFDGVRFEHFSAHAGEASLSEDLSALFAPPGGELWIGARLGGVHRLKDGRLTSYGTHDGLPTNTVLAFAQRPGGSFWVGTTNGLYELVGARWNRVGLERGLPATYISSLRVDAQGTLWVTGLEGSFALAAGAQAFDTKAVGAAGLGLLAPGPGGTLWLSNKLLGLTALGTQERPIDAHDLGDRISNNTAFMFDRDGGLWVSLESGLARVPMGGRLLGPGRAQALRDVQHLPPASGGAAGRVWAMLEDREGNLWFGTNDGLERLRSVKMRPATRQFGALAGAALAVTRAGEVWAANEAGDQIRLAPGPMRQPHGDDGPGVATYAITDDGTRWIGGVSALVGQGACGAGRDAGRDASAGSPCVAATPTRTAAPRAGTVVQAIAGDRSGALWVSLVRGGLYLLRDGEWTLHGDVDGLPEGAAMCLQLADDGRLWAGYTGDRLAVVAGRRTRMLGTADGLRVGAVLAVSVHGERAWVGGTGALQLFQDGRFWSVARLDGSDVTGVSGIVQTAEGELWINGATGVTRIAAGDVAAFVRNPRQRVRTETFDFEDGLDGIAPQLRPLPSAVAGADGRLWFATSKSVYWVDPHRIPRNPVAPTVRILSLRADGHDRAPAPHLALPERTANFAFDYTAFSLTMPERVHFRYRLEGVDAAWQDAGTRRQAYYTNIPPGHYRFHVVAANEDGLWNEAGDAVDLVIPPSFWQTAWFYALCVLAAGALLWSMWTLRLRQLAARMAGELDARLQERERIARELHDTLLQSTQGLILNFQGLALQLPTASPMREKMEKTLDRADLILGEARERVLDLRSSGAPDLALPEAIAQAATALAIDDAVVFATLVEGTPRPLVRAVLVETTRIVREALANAFAHAQATAIEAQILYGATTLRIRIRDNGRGIGADVLAAGARPGHWGLVGMRERARRMGAQLDLWSRAGAGTEVELSVPAAIAYLRERRATPWRRLAARLRAFAPDGEAHD